MKLSDRFLEEKCKKGWQKTITLKDIYTYGKICALEKACQYMKLNPVNNSELKEIAKENGLW